MRDLHARYPFLSGTKEAVAEDDPNIVELVEGDGSETLNRALERVRGAIRDRSIGERHTNPRVEVLSYPVARILVSVTGEPVAYSRLARAEADAVRRELSKTAIAAGDSGAFGDAASGSGTGGDRETLLDEFHMADALVKRDGDTAYAIPVPEYVPLAVAARDDRWKLRRRTVYDGQVHIDAKEINGLIAAAVERRVADGLPVSVPTPISNELREEMADLRDDLNDAGLIRDIDTVAPDLFPPCMSHILEQIQNGEHLEHHARFAITAFLGNIGMTTDEIVDLYTVNPGFAEEMTRYQTDHIQGNTGPIEYSAPACETMKAHGDCYAPDDRCDTIKHPMAYYERALDDTDDAEIEDWRATVTGEGEGEGEGDDEAEDPTEAEESADEELSATEVPVEP